MNNVPNLRFKEFSGEWEKKRFSKYIKLYRGSSPRPIQSYLTSGEGVNWIKIGDAKDVNNYILDKVSEKITYEGSLKSRKVDIGELILANSMSFGATYMLGIQGCIYDGWFVLREYEQYFNKLFLLQQLNSDFLQKQYKKLSTGGVVQNISSDIVYSTKLCCPSLQEQEKIASFFSLIDKKIELQTEKVEELKNYKKGIIQKMFPRNGETVPKLRFAGFTNDWEKRKLEDEFYKVNERNDGSFGKEHWISVAKMYFQDPEKVQSNNIDTRTYVMRYGDIAFEGNKSKSFKYGRFVVNDIGDGVVSELFPIYRHKKSYSNDFWKRAIQIDSIMAPIFSKCITSSGVSSNKLDDKHFLRQSIFVPDIEEQHKIGEYFKTLDKLITLQQRKLDALNEYKKGLLQQMFI